MSGLFEPVGELARWRVLADRFAEVPRGTTVTYEELAQVLDLDPERGRKAVQAAVQQATKVLSVEHDRSLVAVRGVGYRVALPAEHLDLAGFQQRKSGAALVRARRHVDHTDLSGLTEQARRGFHAAAMVLAYQQGQIDQLDLRSRDLEAAVGSITHRVEGEVSDRLAELERRLAALDGDRAE